MISKIIHQIAPENINNWHPVWKICRKTWQENFPDFQHMIWSDVNGIDQFVKENYPQYYDFYISLDLHIMKIDISRYLILHKYGGIYADMDIYCYQNFYDDLDINSICLLDGSKEGDRFENSMIAAPPNCDFFIQCAELCKERFNKIKENKIKYKNNYQCNEYELEVCGPPIISDVYCNYYEDEVLYEGSVFIMEKSLYNMPYFTYDKKYKTKHMLTGIWGNDCDAFSETEEEYKDGYLEFRKINIDEFDFYRNYTLEELGFTS